VTELDWGAFAQAGADGMNSARWWACRKLTWHDGSGVGVRLWLGWVFGLIAGGFGLLVFPEGVVFRRTWPWWHIVRKSAGPNRHVITDVTAAGTRRKKTTGKYQCQEVRHGGGDKHTLVSRIGRGVNGPSRQAWTSAASPPPRLDGRRMTPHGPIPAAPTLAQPHGGKLLWVAPVWALGYSRYMATAKRPPDTLAASLRDQHKCIDDLRASARMRARLMKKIPKPVDFPRGLVEVTNPGPSQGLATAAMGTRIDPSALEEPPLPPDNPSDVTYSTE
jgi:hypothetical protein